MNKRSESSDEFCRSVLPEVSRTFALNIPVLPEPLDLVVTVAYLLCRIADTLEDESGGETSARDELLPEFARLVELPEGWQARVKAFAERAAGSLRAEAPPAEVKLVRESPQVFESFAALTPTVRPHIARCVRTMSEGMREVMKTVEAQQGPQGLDDLEATRTYCYYVAGTVGEMLTGLFIDFSRDAAEKAPQLEARAAAFGRALQLTNILRDIREDLDRGSCWLPRTVMSAHGLTASTLLLPENRERAVAVLDELLDEARKDSDAALEYALTLPKDIPGMRLFCLYPLFFSAATLALLRGNANVFEPAPVKLGRERIVQIMLMTQERVESDDALRALYAACVRGADLERTAA
ncbi:MAG: phytoene/squalene synthase family protein [Myxococcaceae bacterium]